MNEFNNEIIPGGEVKMRIRVLAGCWFCSKSEPNADSEARIRLYKIQTQNQYVYRDVWVPRCAKCKAGHDGAGKLTNWGVKGGVAGGFIIFVSLFIINRQVFKEGIESVFATAILIFIFSVLVALSVTYRQEYVAYMNRRKRLYYLEIILAFILAAAVVLVELPLRGISMFYKKVWLKESNDTKPFKHIMNFPEVIKAQNEGGSTEQPTN